MSNRHQANEPAFFTRRWAGCVLCRRNRAYKPPLNDARSPCCAAPVKTAAWKGWKLKDPDMRRILALYGKVGLDSGYLPGVPPGASG